MKILIVSANFYPLKGGVEMVLEHITDRLSKNHEVKVIANALHKNFGVSAIIKWFKEDSYNGVKIKRIWLGLPKSLKGYIIFPIRFLKSYVSFNREINKFNPDLINYHFPDDTSLYMAVYMYLNPNSKLVTNIHGNDVQLYAQKFFHRIFIGFVLNKSDKIIVNSTYMKDVVLSIFPEIRPKIEIINNGIEYDTISNLEPQKLYKEPYAFYIGRLVHKKGVDVMLKAFAKANIENLKLLVEGNGSEAKSLQDLSEKLGLKDKVFFNLSKFNHTEKIEYLKGAEFGIMPSRIEPFGVVALEIMAAKLAIIASNTGGLKEIITDGVNGMLFENENVDDLCDKIIKIHSDLKLRSKLAENAYIEASKYSWNNILDKYEKVFYSLKK